MSEKYFEMNSDAFETFLKNRGFTRTLSDREVVYIRKHDKNQKLIVKVYTTISDGSNTGARDCGSDAIRIVSILDNNTKTYGIGKFPKIYRKAPETLSVEEKHKFLFTRVLSRMRDAYARCNEWLAERERQKNNVQS